MEVTNIEEKYKKLATEYTKLRTQANVLKRAVLEEQNKNGVLRETIRIKEIDLRRVEQEVDSLSFRNKQLEHRVASLQDDLSKDTGKKPTKFSKGKTNSDSSPARFASTSIDPTLLSDELQKKIIECAQLTSLIADKINEISLQSTRIDELEQLIRSMSVERTNNDDTLRKEIERLERKNHELETKLTEASSIVGSDDTLYVSECEQHQKEAANSVGSSGSRNSSCKMDDRLRQLEKENAQLRAQYEVLQLTFDNRTKDEYSSKDIDLNKIHDSDNTLNVLNDCMADDLIKEKFSKKIEELFMNKCLAETKLTVYIDECESLQRHLDIADSKLRDQERKFSQSQRNLQLTDEDLATTRINYEEQISVLTEQVINLSDQLAALK